MDKKLDTLYDLCETVSKELESANEKINGSGGELSAGDLEYLGYRSFRAPRTSAESRPSGPISSADQMS